MLDSMVCYYFENGNNIRQTPSEWVNYVRDPIFAINELIPLHFELQAGNFPVDLVQKVRNNFVKVCTRIQFSLYSCICLPLSNIPLPCFAGYTGLLNSVFRL